MSNRSNEKEFVCIICPNSCRLTAWKDSKTEEVMITGNQCPRGKEYGINEYINPVRMLITTMRIENALLPIIPIRTVTNIPKGKLFDAIHIVNEAFCVAPIKMGDVLIKNIGNTGINVIASRDMPAISKAGYCEDKTVVNTAVDAIHNTLLEGLYQGATHISEDEAAKLEKIEFQLIERLKKFGLKTD